MLSRLEEFYFKEVEPTKSCLLSLRDIILALDENMTTSLKYGMPFFSYKGKVFCYFWKDKKTKEPYIGIMEGNKIEHPALEKGDRKRIKIFRIDPNEDLPVEELKEVFELALSHYS